MSSIYGERFKIMSDLGVAHSAKLDAILAKDSEIDLNTDTLESLGSAGNASLASLDGKLVACDTSSVSVASSVLPSGASSEASLAALSAKVTACDTSSVSVASSVLPSGASSEASLSALSAKVTACDTSSVSVASSVLPSGASSEASLAGLSAKVTACDTSAVVVSSSSLPSGAASESKQDSLIGHIDGLESLVAATNSALAGTLTVSAPAIVKSSQQVFSAVSIAAAGETTSAEIDLGSAKSIAVLAECSDTASYSSCDLLVSPSSGGTFYESSHSGFFSDGFFYSQASDIPFRFVKLRLKNTSGAADVFSAHLLSSA